VSNSDDDFSRLRVPAAAAAGAVQRGSVPRPAMAEVVVEVAAGVAGAAGVEIENLAEISARHICPYQHVRNLNLGAVPAFAFVRGFQEVKELDGLFLQDRSDMERKWRNSTPAAIGMQLLPSGFNTLKVCGYDAPPTR
jgi:hypothetical protein